MNSSFFSKAHQWLLSPSSKIQDPDIRRRASLMSGLLLVLLVFVLCSIQQAPPDIRATMVAAYPFFVGLYFLSRTRFYTLTAVFLLLLLSAPILNPIPGGPPASAEKILFSLCWQAGPIVLCGILLSIRATLLFAAFSLVGVLSFPMRQAHITLLAVGPSLLFVMFISIFTIIFSRLRQKDLAHISMQNDELSKAMVQAKSATQVKSLFLANVSHELRTPLNAIIGYSELLIEETSHTQAVAQKDLVNILSSGRYLLALVDDVLDLSKIEAGEMKLVRESTALGSLLTGVVETMRSLAEQNGNQLSLVLPEEDIVLHTDHLRVKQSVMNILSNACKFTQHGQIDCTLFCEGQAKPEGAEGGWACIVVADTGIGMSPDELEQVLEPFVQAEQISRTHSGTGLGLAITQQLVQLLGGSLYFKSQPGVGTTATIKLPIHPDASTHPEQPDSPSIA